MEARREQAAVGLFVIVAAGLLIFTVFALGGAFSSSAVTYRAYFPFAGGIEPGAIVRYSGGQKIGRVEMLRIDPQNSARLEITISVKQGLPIKSDSKVRIMSMSALGDNHVEIMPGSPQAPAAPPGSTLPSEPYTDFNDVTAQIKDIGPKAQELLKNLNQRAIELQETIVRVNDVLNAQNRANLSATISNTRGMLEENRPAIKSSITNVESASHKIGPLLDDLRKTSAEANKTIEHVDEILVEDRPEIHSALVELRQNLAQLQRLTGQLNSTLDTNSENIDELLENLRHVSENLREFTEIIKDAAIHSYSLFYSQRTQAGAAMRVDITRAKPDFMLLAQNEVAAMNGLKKVCALGSLAIAVGLACGCGAARPSKYYQLTPPSNGTTTAAQDPLPVSLLLGRMQTSHLYREDRIVYSSERQQMGTYETERWSEPPVEMFQDVMLRKLRSSGRYRDVSTMRSGAHADYVLRGRLYDFKEVSTKPMVARLSFELELQDAKTNGTVWTHVYNYDEPVSGKDVPSLVAALDRNVQRAVGEVAGALDQYFSSRPPK